MSVLSSTSCAISSSAPIVIHSKYGEMSAESELFKKDAQECALKASERKGITLDQNSTKVETGIALTQVALFFSSNAYCITNKGWRIKE